MSISGHVYAAETHRTKRILSAVAHRYPDAWAHFDRFRRERGRKPDFDWPDWCYLPIAAGCAVVSRGGTLPTQLAGHPAIVTALGTWRMTQGIYRFDHDLAQELIKTPFDGDIPVEHLHRLPEWCVYIETEGLGLGEMG